MECILIVSRKSATSRDFLKKYSEVISACPIVVREYESLPEKPKSIKTLPSMIVKRDNIVKVYDEIESIKEIIRRLSSQKEQSEPKEDHKTGRTPIRGDEHFSDDKKLSDAKSDANASVLKSSKGITIRRTDVADPSLNLALRIMKSEGMATTEKDKDGKTFIRPTPQGKASSDSISI